MTNLIASDAQGQQVDSGLVNLFELTSGSSTYYFCEGLSGNLVDVKMRDKDSPSTIRTYTAIPMQMEGIEVASSGASARPTLSIANITTALKTATNVTDYDDLTGATVMRRQTLEKYLDDGTGNSPNPPVEMPTVRYKIDRIASETPVIVTFELAAIYDMEGVSLPRRVTVGKFCSWMYQGRALQNNGGCVWRTDSQIRTESTGGGTSIYHDIFYNVKDHPLVQQSFLNGVSAWSAGAAVTQNDYRSYNSKFYRAEIGHTTSNSNDPEEQDGHWKEVFGYTTYSGSTTYAKDALVKHTVSVDGVSLTTIWKSTHAGNVGNTPALKSVHWIREEQCGKTLYSCKCRYGALTIANTTNSAPSAKIDTSAVLPFGGFPGTAKF